MRASISLAESSPGSVLASTRARTPLSARDDSIRAVIRSIVSPSKHALVHPQSRAGRGSAARRHVGAPSANSRWPASLASSAGRPRRRSRTRCRPCADGRRWQAPRPGHRSEGAGRLIIEDFTAKARSEASWSSYRSFLFAALRPPDARRSENGDEQIPLDRLP